MIIHIFTFKIFKAVLKITGFSVNNNHLNLCVQVENSKRILLFEKQFLNVHTKAGFDV